ncbi:MAG: hypothetical protein A2V70_19750 [Planctomycetes bacterium RBG_13_63_9]|nr:MAG: hypothetical protein A2V70_19750 [Planctomycetes bacterium RBG_13_63_9]
MSQPRFSQAEPILLRGCIVLFPEDDIVDRLPQQRMLRGNTRFLLRRLFWRRRTGRRARPWCLRFGPMPGA